MLGFKLLSVLILLRNKTRWIRHCVFLLTGLCSLSVQLATASESQCVTTSFDEQVELDYVNDGDTITLKDGRLVRLIGIDSPEMDFQYPALSEPYAKEARHFLQQHLQLGQLLNLSFDRKKLDPYGRTLAYVYTLDGEHLQETLLRKGYAKTRVYQNDYFWECLNEVELNARDKNLGLWSHPDYQAKTVDKLNRDDLNRWGEIKGVVTGFERKSQHLWLILDNKFYIGIPRQDSSKFINILNLKLLETPIIARGTLYYSYKKWQLISSHPSQISLQNKP
ncbi:thermonuclease family protein [Shewanella eurypsychrophilus]|uniref:Thermonuclease family protein n=1 Tax=Shewanella eurypsychrophilus TaxID=2593656 RepID=A0ABX6VI90_9GAMM|nr:MULTISPECIES: thermonuclease family protein [Shewanella]QFU24660.1 thermonuclease family protein [Shewanella sp. YLB-09]QPG59854.1 thermonuclease family protein [Shewanella eurypsychrophilus]